MRTLITGANGLIGSHLAERLSAMGDEICLISRESSGFQNFLDGKMPILIGDSFGLGVCIQNELYLKNIKKKVLNLSVSGSGPISQIALIKEFLKKFKTNKIIWLFYEGNDLLDLEIEKKNIIFKEYFESS